MQRSGHHLGVLIQSLWTYFNPGRIVLGGPLCALGAPFLDAARASLERYAVACGMTPPELRLYRFGAQSVAVGAAVLVKYARLRPLEQHRDGDWFPVPATDCKKM